MTQSYPLQTCNNGEKVKTQTVRCVEREGSYVAYSIMMTRSCKSGEIYMATWQCPSGVCRYAGNGEEKDHPTRSKDRYNIWDTVNQMYIDRYLWECQADSWQKSISVSEYYLFSSKIKFAICLHILIKI